LPACRHVRKFKPGDPVTLPGEALGEEVHEWRIHRRAGPMSQHHGHGGITWTVKEQLRIAIQELFRHGVR
jgi:hypothetical protein